MKVIDGHEIEDWVPEVGEGCHYACGTWGLCCNAGRARPYAHHFECPVALEAFLNSRAIHGYNVSARNLEANQF